MSTDQQQQHHQPTAFPRGKRKQQSSTTTSSSSSRPKDVGGKPSKKRLTDAASASHPEKKDFLFGNDGLDTVVQMNSYNKQRMDGTTDHHDNAELLEIQQQQRQLLMVTSQLPLGGGAVLPPTQTSNGKRRIPARIESLTFSKFARGTKVLGVVREVTDEYAVVSLPTMLTGFVRRGSESISSSSSSSKGDRSPPPLTRVLPEVNTVMAFYVLSTTTTTDERQTAAAARARGTTSAQVTKRRIELSPWPVHVNAGVQIDEYLSPKPSTSVPSAPPSPMVVRGRVVSVEDHGCIVDLGGILQNGQCAFLQFDNVEGDYEIVDENEDGGGEEDDEDEVMVDGDSADRSTFKRKLNPNRIYDFSILPANITSSNNTSSHPLRTILQLGLPSTNTLARLRATSSMMPSLSSLQPGMLTEVHVEAHAKNGICVSFNNGVYRGSIDEDHLGGHRGVEDGGKNKKISNDGESGTNDPNMWWKSVFKGKHAKFTARIIAVDAATKIVRFSLNANILALDGEYTSLFPYAVGSVIKNAKVIRVDPGIGALLALPSSSSGIESNAENDAIVKERRRQEIVQLVDKDLANNLLTNSVYNEASKVSTAYVHISKAMDNEIKPSKKGIKQQGNDNNNQQHRTPDALFARHFSMNTRIKSLRILSTSNLFDGIASCATAKSVVEAHVLTHADIQPGKIYKDVPVMQLLESGGVLVNLGVGTKGLIPAIHLFDKASHGTVDAVGGDGILSGYRSKIRQAKYKVGNLVSVRCLTVDVASRQCVLTAKKTLLANDIADPIVDYASITPGKVAAGFVSKVDDSGLTVTFYNNVHGRVSSRSLAAELGVEDPKVNYSVGDVVAARVLDCVRRRNRHVTNRSNGENSDAKNEMYYYHLILSLKTVVENSTEEKQKAVADEGKVNDGESVAVPLAAGSILTPKRMKVLQLVNCLRREDGIVLPGYAVVSVKSKFFKGMTPAAGESVECKLPYEQLLDSFGSDLVPSSSELDDFAQRLLTVGKRIDAEGFLLSVPTEGDSLPVVSLRQSIIDTIKRNQSSASSPSDDLSISCPSPRSNIFMGEYVRGYVTRIDSRFGAFVRFLDGLTGLIPKLKKGLDEKLYDTIICKVTALDIASFPPKILLKRVSESEIVKKRKKHQAKNEGANGVGQLKVGDVVGDVKIVEINFARAKVLLLDNHTVRARIHVTMANSLSSRTKLSKTEKQLKEELKIGKSHPFYNWKVGDIISGVRCVALDNREGVLYLELSNMSGTLPCVVTDPAHLPPGSILSTIVTSVSTKPSSHHGLWVQVCPGISGFISALELSTDANVLNDLESNYAVGSRVTCCVVEGTKNIKTPPLPPRCHQTQVDDQGATTKVEHNAVELSVLLVPGENHKQSVFKPTKPRQGDLVVGRINARARMIAPPSLMLSLRGNFVGRCCVTELADVGDWDNMPLGKFHKSIDDKATGEGRVVSSDSDTDHPHDEDGDEASGQLTTSSVAQNDYPDGKYVVCRVLGGPAKAKGILELSLRDSRLGGTVDDDRIPNINEIATAYVVSTTKQGCFIRLSRSVEGRVILKELSDDFIPNPSAVFPPGRLVVGKIKHVKESQDAKKCTMVDVDMRESVLLASGDRLSIEDIQENSKYTGVITRVESYGVFVRIDNSDVSGLAHVSECSDSFIKNIFDLYNPGDFVKLVVISMDKEQRRLAFSLKASNFVDDDDDDDDDSEDEESSSSSSDEVEENSDSDGSYADSMDSDDEAFVSKLAKKMETKEDDMELDDGDINDNVSSEHSSSFESDDESDDESDEEQNVKSEILSAMDTNVGFDWGTDCTKSAKSHFAAESSDEDDESSSSESSGDESDDADSGFKSSHKARKKAASKKREEEETSRREAALADGTADETPETTVDFERLVASNPNSSEVWIKYMAFHLSLADIDSARIVAERAFKRIEFREEGEKLNVWTALLTLELKYGTDKSLHETIDSACKQNNPKHVYLRVCELLDKEVDAAASAVGSTDLETAFNRADEMFKKMCKKFKSKKSVWLAHFRFLLKSSRHEEAHALLKRSLQSLTSHKQVEVMSKYAQMEFELGSPERGRTIFNALLEKHPKRMDLLFVNIDKEVKNGDISKARALFESVVNPVSSDRKFKFSNKQMKSLFKKWYRLEEEHGNEESQDHVKEEARAFVAKSNP